MLNLHDPDQEAESRTVAAYVAFHALISAGCSGDVAVAERAVKAANAFVDTLKASQPVPGASSNAIAG